MAGIVKHSYTPEKRSVGNLLSMTSPAIIVPDWQRNYSWRIEHVETFWNDVVRFSERSGEILTEEYFFGSVVLVNGADQRLLLLDGQQRLATSTILLSAIRDTIVLFNKGTAAYIQNNWLSGFDEIKQDEIQKIRLNIYDRDFFKRLVSDPRGENYAEPEPAYASHNLIAAARAFFLKSISERIEPLDEKAASAWLRRIVAILTDHFTVIAAFSDNEDSAAEVFETLNDRGIGLSTPDLLRNLVIRRAAANQRDDVVARWESVIAFAAWLGLTPLQNCSGGKERLGRISKMGDQYLRRLLINGMTSLVARNARRPDMADPRITALLARKPLRVATVAMANHAARAIWAIMVRGETYRAPAALRAAAA